MVGGGAGTSLLPSSNQDAAQKVLFPTLTLALSTQVDVNDTWAITSF